MLNLNYNLNYNDQITNNILNLNKEFVNEVLFSENLKPGDTNNIFLNQLNNVDLFELLTSSTNNSLQNLSTPDFKLHYPEPFIASPSFNHEEVWFLHILHYQHWLWFMFISLIMFYFITFINVIRWCNPRNRPKKETRGVSRSKCADLITSCVPLTWAASIIISESVDAADYYDGFGTGEIVIGIRAYQWGWEYFYPKGIDLNYNINPSYSSLVGNSIKYNNSEDSNLSSNLFWKNFKNNNKNLSSSPLNVLLSTKDNSNLLNFINLNTIGSSTLNNSSAFKKVQFFSKISPQFLYMSENDYTLKYSNFSNIYKTNFDFTDSLSYKTLRQHNYNNNLSINNKLNTYMDLKGVDKLLNYNLNSGVKKNDNPNFLYNIDSYGNNLDQNMSLLNKGKGITESLNQNTNSNFFNKSDLSYNFIDLKSNNKAMLPSDRTIRILDNFNVKNIQNNFKDKNFSFEKLGSLNTVFPLSHLPTKDLDNSNLNLSYDKFSDDGSLSNILRSKEESAPNFIFNSYWLTLWSNSINDNRVNSIINIYNTLNKSYIPLVIDYNEYDFKNWQTLDLMEDSFWESTYPSGSHEDYMGNLSNLKLNVNFSKQENIFNNLNRSDKLKLDTNENQNNRHSISLFSEEFFNDTSLLNLKNFSIYNNEVNIDNIGESYDNNKNLNYLHYLNYLNTYNVSLKSNYPISYTQVLNSFRADLSENLVNIDNKQFFYNLNDLNTLNNYNIRIVNPLKLRSTAKNSIITYSAIQKVFKSRFDEGRSNVRLSDVSNSSVSYPFISEDKSKYESLLGKNKDSFYNVTNYNIAIKPNYSNMLPLVNSLNIYFTDIPFLISNQSDSSRYLWFDWHSRWTSLEVQPSSVARYSLIGLPYSSKNFEYKTQLGDDLNESETYLIRLSRARKNYMSNWIFSPYFYQRLSNWSNLNSLHQNLYKNSLLSLRLNLELVNLYWISSDLNTTTPISTLSYSGYQTPGRSNFKPNTFFQGYNYNVTTFVDLLSKRESLYREYYLNKGLSINLPKFLLANPQNPLLKEVKSSFPMVDSLLFSSEINKNIFFNENSSFLNTFGFNLLPGFKYIFSNILNVDKNIKIDTNFDLFKNQYRPMKKGIVNMVRLHATSAIAMPIETRLHILTSSKDVIHSWAIPSAGIKMDCIPGYSSHRISIFLVSGIFWGQCMEICGRFHHWMPIIVYFMKRDLFFLWCTHFMHYSADNNSFTAPTKDLIDYSKPVSYNKLTWSKESLNIL